MRYSSIKIKVTQFYFLFSILLIVFLNYGNLYSYQSTRQFEDNNFYFSVQLPSDWETEQSNNDSTLLRLNSLSPDQKYSFSIYSVRISNGYIDLKKFSNFDTKFFTNLGYLIKQDSTKKEILKTYKNNNLITKLIFKTDSNFGYILMYRTLKEDFEILNKISDTFYSNVPFLNLSFFTAIKSRFPKIYSIFGDFFSTIIVGLLLLGIPAAFAGISLATQKYKVLNIITIVICSGGVGLAIWGFLDSLFFGLFAVFIIVLIMTLIKMGILLYFEEG